MNSVYAKNLISYHFKTHIHNNNSEISYKKRISSKSVDYSNLSTQDTQSTINENRSIN